MKTKNAIEIDQNNQKTTHCQTNTSQNTKKIAEASIDWTSTRKKISVIVGETR